MGLFTIDHAARILRAEIEWLKRLLRLTKASRTYETTGLVGAETMRMLYSKLHG